MSRCSKNSLVGVPDAGKICTVLIVASDVGSGDVPPGSDKKGLLAVKVTDWCDLNTSRSASFNILFSVCSIKSLRFKS